MAEPLAPWHAGPEFRHEKLVFSSGFDDRYHIEVQRTGESTGNLYIFDHDDGNKELAYFEVHLAYGPSYLPDITDVRMWSQIATDFIDNKED